MSEWNIMVTAELEKDFVRLFCRLNEDFGEFSKLLAYMNNTLIDKYKESFVAYSTNRKMHFRNA